MSQPLFDQLSTQLNFLLLSQRQMIITSALGLAVLNFSTSLTGALKLKKIYLTYLSLTLLIYSIAVGIKAAMDFEDFIKTVKDEEILDPGETKFANRSRTWIYYSYFLIAIICIMASMLIFARNVF